MARAMTARHSCTRSFKERRSICESAKDGIPRKADYVFLAAAGQLCLRCGAPFVLCQLQEKLTEDELRRILDGDIAWMVTSGRPLLAVLYVEMKAYGLRSKCVVEYMRVPFVYGPGNVRVTIDWNIRTGQGSHE